MRMWTTIAALAVLTSTASVVSAATISGEYLESRTCDVYTGPCFANAEMDLAGKEAVMAWKVDQGTWNGISLDGLGVAVVLNAENTLGNDGVFEMKAGRIESIILVDEQATAAQHNALIAFARDSVRELTQNVVKVESVPFQLQNDHLDGKGIFRAGDLAQIETRALKKGDCVCTNELVFYQPLADVDNFSPAYSKTLSFQGEGLRNRWTAHELRSSFLATFRR